MGEAPWAGLEGLPPEVVVMVLGFLADDARDVVACALTCRSIWAVGRHDAVWKQVYVRFFGPTRRALALTERRRLGQRASWVGWYAHEMADAMSVAVRAADLRRLFRWLIKRGHLRAARRCLLERDLRMPTTGYCVRVLRIPDSAGRCSPRGWRTFGWEILMSALRRRDREVLDLLLKEDMVVSAPHARRPMPWMDARYLCTYNWKARLRCLVAAAVAADDAECLGALIEWMPSLFTARKYMIEVSHPISVWCGPLVYSVMLDRMHSFEYLKARASHSGPAHDGFNILHAAAIGCSPESAALVRAQFPECRSGRLFAELEDGRWMDGATPAGLARLLRRNEVAATLE